MSFFQQTRPGMKRNGRKSCGEAADSHSDPVVTPLPNPPNSSHEKKKVTLKMGRSCVFRKQGVLKSHRKVRGT